MGVALILLCLAAVGVVAILIANAKKRLNTFRDNRPNIESMLCAFAYDLSNVKKSYISHSVQESFLEEHKRDLADLRKTYIPKSDPLFDISKETIALYDSFSMDVGIYNKAFVENEKRRCQLLFGNIDGRSLDDQQREAVVTDEDHMLVVAGAGSGKTLTISAKVKYLVEEKSIGPSDILLITFTKKASEEMTERINKRLGINVEATTFHKLGLDIIGRAKGFKPDVDEDMEPFLQEYFKDLVNNTKQVKALLDFFSYFMYVPTDVEDYETLGEAYEHQKSLDFQTLKGKYSDSKFNTEGLQENVRERLRTLAGERVRSLQEASIANFLFLHGVKYEYEKQYPYQEADECHRVYKPDFYLPDYDIYLEHFGINREGRLPWLSKIEEEKYLEGMGWKRSLHARHETKLIETYSYYETEDRLLTELEKILIENGVAFKSVDVVDVFKTVYCDRNDRFFIEFQKLCSTFIGLAKSAGYKPENISKLGMEYCLKHMVFFDKRTKVFKSIIIPLFEEYEKYLASKNSIDFADMINQATAAVRNNVLIKNYRYIVVDEFQDISQGRFALIEAIMGRTGAKLFCVGDDWQSIYRFAGSDISLFTKFEDRYKGTKLLRIEKTYRNSQELVDTMWEFIRKNPLQIEKQLMSDKQLDKPVQFMEYSGLEELSSAIEMMIDEFAKASGENSSVLLLGRTKFDFEDIERLQIFTPKRGAPEERVYLKYPRMSIRLLTVHKSKGLEADNVILVNFQNVLLGFPNKIADDPLLGLILSESESFPYAEERRLLYVALTRTKNYSFILVNGELAPSEFTHDFETLYNQRRLAPHASEKISNRFYKDRNIQGRCPRCKSGRLVQREGPSGLFYGCSNFPQCDFTLNGKPQMRCSRCFGIMVERRSKTGERFLGCSNYPKCRKTECLIGDGFYTFLN